MRSTIIGIIIGIVVGVMVGATVIAPGLQQARHQPPGKADSGVENLNVGESAHATDADRLRPSAASQSGDGPQVRIISLFPAKMPILGDMAQRLEQTLSAASGGRMNVTLYPPDALVPAVDTFDAVKSGTVEAAFAAPGQWDVDSTALQLFTAVPFGPGADEHLAWFYHGGGRELFEGLFKRHGVHALLCGAIPPEGSGWYRQPVRAVDGFKGLNVRAFGLSARVLQKMGTNVVNLDVGGILSAFENGRLDGAEYSLPSVDAKLGFNRFARNYYFPGWQQPVTLFALAINAKTWEGLAPFGRALIESTCGDNVRHTLTRADAAQFEALKQLGLAGVQVRRWPDPVLSALERAWIETARELALKDPDFNAAWSSLHLFRRDYAIWRDLSRP